MSKLTPGCIAVLSAVIAVPVVGMLERVLVPDPLPYAPMQRSALEELPLGQVQSVIDGDSWVIVLPEVDLTLEVDLLGVSAPGLRQPFGPEAAWFARSLVEGEQVGIVWASEQPADGGRRKALLYRFPDGLLLNLELIRAGLGVPRPTQDEDLDALFARYAQRAQALTRNATGGAQPLAAAQQSPGSPVAAVPEGDIPASATPVQQAIRLFITPSGSRYHREGCRFVSETATEISLDRAQGRYQPCRVCKPDQTDE